MQKTLTKILENIGFSEKEALVYLACLELGSAKNLDITKKTGLNRITNYEILKRLSKQGAIKSYQKHSATFFMATDPRIVIKQTKEKVALAEEKIPELLALTNELEKKPKIYFFEGLEGIKNIYEDSLQAKTAIFTFTNPQDLVGLLKDYHDNYLQQRVKQKIPVHGLAPNDPVGQKSKMDGKSVLRDVRLFPADKYSIHNEIMIYDNKVAIYSGKDEIGLLIENSTIANTWRNIWNMVWDSAEK
jgi:sugar-specific transcriptional regulator TrmB